MHFPP
jgi:hypothetical protein